MEMVMILAWWCNSLNCLLCMPLIVLCLLYIWDVQEDLCSWRIQGGSECWLHHHQETHSIQRSDPVVFHRAYAGQLVPHDSKLANINLGMTSRSNNSSTIKHSGICFLPESRKKVQSNTTWPCLPHPQAERWPLRSCPTAISVVGFSWPVLVQQLTGKKKCILW